MDSLVSPIISHPTKFQIWVGGVNIIETFIVVAFCMIVNFIESFLYTSKYFEFWLAINNFHGKFILFFYHHTKND